MPTLVIKFGGTVEPIDGGARVFGEANIDGPELTDADGDRLKDAVMDGLKRVWSGEMYSAASVAADPAPLQAAFADQMMISLLKDGATATLASITVVGGGEPAEATDAINLNEELDLSDGKKKLIGSVMVGGVADLAAARQVILRSAEMIASIGGFADAASAFRQVAAIARLELRSDGNLNANVKVMFLQLI